MTKKTLVIVPYPLDFSSEGREWIIDEMKQFGVKPYRFETDEIRAEAMTEKAMAFKEYVELFPDMTVVVFPLYTEDEFASRFEQFLVEEFSDSEDS